MLPNPNTANIIDSTDGTDGTAFIDDFEGGKRNFPLGISYATWKFGSPPRIDTSIIRHGIAPEDETRYKGRGFWYNVYPPNTIAKNVFPNRSTRSAGETIQVLDVNFEPNVRGIYNYPSKKNPPPAPLELNNSDTNKVAWHSMMHTLSGVDFARDHLTSIELMMQIDPNGNDLDSGKMFIELGEVSEDVIPNHTLNNEDGLDGGPPNGILNHDLEDVGLDSAFSVNEEGYNQSTNPDPAGDDYSYTPGTQDYTHINGLERNADTEAGQYPDNEDLNHNGVLDYSENYFQYQVQLNPTTSKQIVGGNPSKNWYLYRIPLKDTSRRVGSPSNTPTFIRVWFQGYKKSVHFRIAELNLVGSQWEKVTTMQVDSNADSNCELAFVNVEENSGPPDHYLTPPTVRREVDRTQIDQNILRNEQSLAIKYKTIKKGEDCAARKVFPQQPLDVMSYSMMKIFVHGDTRLHTVDATHNAAEVFIRFGLDNFNYYEYREPLRGDWNEMVVHFPDVTSLKSKRRNFSDSVGMAVPGGPAGSTYTLKGNPSLTNLQFFMMGVYNAPGAQHDSLPANSQVWFDELRVVGAERTISYAVRTTTSIKLADFGSVSASVEYTQPNFHKLEEHFGGRATQTAWSASLGLWRLKKRCRRKWHRKL